MATCLRCDSCEAIASEEDGNLARWWRVERYGATWVDEPGRGIPTMQIPVVEMNTSFHFDGPLQDPDDHHDGMAQDFDPTDDPGMVLHFCKAACLCKWASEAAVFDGMTEGAEG